jgi:hypothetical protein
MSQEKQDKLIDKVRKLLALSKSPNEHEATLAMEKAQEILKTYNLTLTEVEVKNIVERRIKMGKLTKWKIHLASAVAAGFDTKLYMLGTQYLVFCGTKVDTEVSEYAYEYLKGTVEALLKSYVSEMRKPKTDSELAIKALGIDIDKKPVKNATSYAYGIVLALEIKIKEFAAKKAVMPAPLGSTDLIPLKNLELQKYWEEKMEKASAEFGTRQELDEEAFKQGHKDGESISLHRGVE